MNLFNKLKAMSILLIDDDEWIRDSLSLYFENEGCHLLALETAEEGMKALKKHACNIIIVDYRLPGMDGLGFFRHIQRSHPEALKILITAYGSENVLSEARSIGVQDIVEKPFTTEIIEMSLTKLVTEKTQ